MAGNVDIGAVLGQQLLQVAQVMEDQVDQEIRQLERMDEDDLEAIKRRRMGEFLFGISGPYRYVLIMHWCSLLTMMEVQSGAVILRS